MKKILLISGSLNKNSLSFQLLNQAQKAITENKAQSEYIDLRKEDIPFCDGRIFNQYPKHLHIIYKKIKNADALIFGMPVYCYSVSGPLKNFIDIFAKAFHRKYFGICMATGSKLSYLASTDLIKIMNFECQALGIQPTVMVDSNDFSSEGNLSTPLQKKLDDMVRELLSKN